MAERVQISCEKQGSNDTSSWSTRVLTMDRATGTLVVSRHHHPNNVLYHAIRVREVQPWPHYRPGLIEESHDSLDAKRTVHLVGIEVPVPHFTVEDAANHQGAQDGSLPPATASADSPSSEASPGAAAQYTFMAGDSRKKSRGLQSGGYESWVVRFNTQDSYELAMVMLQSMSHVHVAHELSAEDAAAAVPPIGAPIVPAVGPL